MTRPSFVISPTGEEAIWHPEYEASFEMTACGKCGYSTRKPDFKPRYIWVDPRDGSDQEWCIGCESGGITRPNMPEQRRARLQAIARGSRRR